MANTLSIDQVCTVLNSVVQQATGAADMVATDTASFVTVAKYGLEKGYDPLMTAISQVLSRTLFAVRPYSAKFKGLMADSIRYGNHVRKINYIDKPTVESRVLQLTEGQSEDQYIVRKPEVVQTNFYGGGTWQDYITRYTEQLDTAFSGPEEFGRFISGLMTELTNKHEQENESMARMALVNFIGGKIAGDTSNVIHLITEYNALTGLNLTAQNVYTPDNFKPFMQWVYSRIVGLCAMMTERSVKFHTNLNIGGQNKLIMRHTPYAQQKIYLTAQNRYQSEAWVLANTYHDKYLKMADFETVNYWQDIDNPTSIKVYESYLKPDGTIATNSKKETGDAPTTTDKLFGVIFDEEAVGVTMINNSLTATPINARGLYTNLWWNSTYRWWNDFTENGIVLLLD